jgi:hypothetical protein
MATIVCYCAQRQTLLALCLHLGSVLLLVVCAHSLVHATASISEHDVSDVDLRKQASKPQTKQECKHERTQTSKQASKQSNHNQHSDSPSKQLKQTKVTTIQPYNS